MNTKFKICWSEILENLNLHWQFKKKMTPLLLNPFAHSLIIKQKVLPTKRANNTRCELFSVSFYLPESSRLKPFTLLYAHSKLNNSFTIDTHPVQNQNSNEETFLRFFCTPHLALCQATVTIAIEGNGMQCLRGSAVGYLTSLPVRPFQYYAH